MSLNIDEIKDVIRDWALGVTGSDVIWAKFDGKQPSAPFVSLNIERTPQNHEDYVGSEVDESGNISIVGHRTLVINVLVLGSSDDLSNTAMQIAENLKASLQKPSVQYTFREFGISVVNQTDPQDVSFLYTGTSWEKRATFDATFGAAFTDSDNVGYFNTIEISGEAKNETGQTINNIDITVP